MDAYRIGIVLSLTNNASGVLRLFQKDLAGSEKAAASLEKAMKRIHAATVMAGAAAGIAFGLDKALKPAMEYQNQLSKVTVQLNNQKDTALMVASAWKTAEDVLTSTPTENLKVGGETAFAFGDPAKAAAANAQFMKMAAIVSVFSGKDGVDQAFDAGKLQELRANMGSVDGFMRGMNAMTKTVEATFGKVGPQDYYAFAKMSSPYLLKFSDQFLYNEAPTMMQDMNPSKAGTAVTTLEQFLVGGRMTKAQFKLMQEGGLLDKTASYKTDSMGKVQLDKLKLKGGDLAASDPYQYTLQYIVPMLNKLSGGDQSLWPALISKIFPVRTEARAITDFIFNAQRVAKDNDFTQRPAGIEQDYQTLLKTNPQMAQMAAAAQWDKLWISIGYQIVPKLIPLIDQFAKGLDRLAGIASRHSEVTKIAVGVAAVTAAVLALGSALSIFSVGLSAVRVAAFGAGATPGLAGVAVGGALRAAVPAAAGAAMGYGFGNWFAKKDQDGFLRFKSWMDSWLPKSAQVETPGYAVPPANKSSSVTHGSVFLDSKKVGSVLWQDAGRRINGPNGSTGLIDLGMSYVPNN